MTHDIHPLHHVTRRHFLQGGSLGLGSIALGSLFHGKAAAGYSAVDNPLAAKPPQFTARAKRVIFLHMAGGPPQHDLFDYKPKLVEMNGKDCPKEVFGDDRFPFIKGVPKLLGTEYQFQQHGESGAWVSELLPGIAGLADDLVFIKSMYTDQFNHGPAQLLLYTGSPRNGGASMGSWVTYGLGSENQDMPAFVVLISGGTNPAAGKAAWGSGFLPSVYQGVQCRTKGDPVLYVSNPPGIDARIRRRTLDAIGQLNQIQSERLGSPETLTRIAQYELAYRMQMSVPEVMDISRETKQTLEMYGATPGESSLANNCLLARRLVEQGVRFVQLFDWGWDFHGASKRCDIKGALPGRCSGMDRPVSALLRDLKQRGLLEETLVVWGAEFGRTPLREARHDRLEYVGRDHHPHSFTTFLAGGGIKAGMTYGRTDELGYRVVENKVHVHDLQATILHLLGFDHEQHVFPFQGRDFRLTDVHGNVVRRILS